MHALLGISAQKVDTVQPSTFPRRSGSLAMFAALLQRRKGERSLSSERAQWDARLRCAARPDVRSKRFLLPCRYAVNFHFGRVHRIDGSVQAQADVAALCTIA